MEKRDSKKKILVVVLVIFFLCIFISGFFLHHFITKDFNSQEDVKTYANTIVVLGTYENELFLKQVCNGVRNNSEAYNAVVDFHVPESMAEDVSLQSLFDYAAFVNADGIIAFIPSVNEIIQNVVGIKGEEIPIVTTGQFAPGTQQISFIGTSYWELGRKFGEEIKNYFENKNPNSKKAFILCSDYYSNPNFSNLTNSIQSYLVRHSSIQYEIIDQITEEFIIDTVRNNLDSQILFVGLTEEDTLLLAQLYTELNLNKNEHVSLFGFGSNETCQSYLSKGIINELVSLDPEKIGEAALRELFEYKNHGYANSYMAADIKIMKAAE